MYTNNQRILIVGDGNLSFSLSLASLVGPVRITATTYDSPEAVVKKYPEAATNIELLSNMGVEVLHRVDATRLQAQTYIQKDAGGHVVPNDGTLPQFDRIIFNFPHAGGSSHEDIVANRALLKGFFESAGRLVKDHIGEIHVSLRRNKFYDSWKILNVAKATGLMLFKEVPFHVNRFPGYVVRRTTPAQREAPGVESARQYMFKRKPGSKHFKKPFSSPLAAEKPQSHGSSATPTTSASASMKSAPVTKKEKALAAQRLVGGSFSEKDFMGTSFGMEFSGDLDDRGNAGESEESEESGAEEETPGKESQVTKKRKRVEILAAKGDDDEKDDDEVGGDKKRPSVTGGSNLFKTDQAGQRHSKKQNQKKGKQEKKPAGSGGRKGTLTSKGNLRSPKASKNFLSKGKKKGPSPTGPKGSKVAKRRFKQK